MNRKIAMVVSSVLGLATTAVLLPSQPAEAAVECVSGTVTRNAQGRITQCQLARSWRFAQRMVPQNSKPTVEFVCRGQQSISFHPTGAIAACTLDRPIAIEQSGIRDQCSAGRQIYFTEQGLLQLPNWCR
ncbi:hypothetical protein [Pantanalinema sp. GBBB05]|uniref:hypothetical protein n=1 Tax=Pantanalinema sp. GBBB05 TaxID=2604139 RepID=UPI001D1D3819|nr:hypothetical protein [Pantanalinema sp. GBBB05]